MKDLEPGHQKCLLGRGWIWPRYLATRSCGMGSIGFPLYLEMVRTGAWLESRAACIAPLAARVFIELRRFAGRIRLEISGIIL